MSSSDSDDEDWVPYKEREEWKDVQPIPQDDGPYPVVAIAYSDKFRDIYDYLRAVLKLDERSERALRLTEDAISLNPANYTVWHYRREILKSLNKNLEEELCYISDVIKDQPKNYQVWYHRGIIVSWLNDPSQEFEFTAEILRKDAKNYHAWQHRQAIVNGFQMWDSEIAFVTSLLEDDLRNNSAWNHRYYTVLNTTGFTDDVAEKELNYCSKMIQRAPNNESAWNYMKGVLDASGGIAKWQEIVHLVFQMYDNHIDSPYLLSFLIDYYDEVLQSKANEENLTKALELCEKLAEDIDCIRKNYWNYRSRCLQAKFRKS